jgi:hypothetical protein
MTTIGHAWLTLTGSLAAIVLILTAYLVEHRPDVLKHIGAILGIVVMLMLIPTVLVNPWSSISSWRYACTI